MLTVEEALELIAKNAEPLAARRVALGEAAGLVLAEEIRSDVNSPPYDKALMDGYAVRSSDRQPERRILEEIAAGAVPRFPITPGTTSRIMTGAPLPEGADAVVQLERTELADEHTVRLQQPELRPGQNVLPLGAALRAGDVVLREGAFVRAIEIGLLAEIGRGMVSAIPRPRIAILPTGNEIVPVGDKSAPGQIRNSNGPMLKAMAARVDADAIELGIARDSHDELRSWVEQGLAADVLVLSGGVSAGKFDLVPHVLAELGVEQVFHKIALRPGKPLWFGVKHSGERRVLVFGLPGNPVSSLVCFELFVRPAVMELAGRGFTSAKAMTAQLSHDFEHAGERMSYLPARVEDDGAATILEWQGSADLATLSRANGLARFAAGAGKLSAGSKVDIVPI